jgi:cytidine deaminase
MRKFSGDRLPDQDLPEVADVIYDIGGIRQDLSTAQVYEIAAKPYDQLPRLAVQALAAARKEAISYRGFFVGAAAYASDPENMRTALLFGANYKPFEGAPKRCAEMEVLEKAHRRDFKKIRAIAIAGPIQADTVSGVQSETLHPCFECRQALREHPLIYPDTMVLTVDEDGATYETYDMRELYRIHGENFFDGRTDLYGDDVRLEEEMMAFRSAKMAAKLYSGQG